MDSKCKHVLLPECGVLPNPLTDYTYMHGRKHAAIARTLLGVGADARGSLCLVCLKQSWQYGDLLDKYEIHSEMFTSSVTLLTVIHEVFTSKIQPAELRRVCNDCIQRLVQSYIFLKQYQINKHILQSSIQELFANVPSIDTVIDTRQDSKKLLLKLETIVHANQPMNAENKRRRTNLFKPKSDNCSMCSPNCSNNKIHSSDTKHLSREYGNVIQTCNALNGHIKRSNEIEHDFMCAKCRKIFTEKEFLKRDLKVRDSHKKLQNEQSNRIAICELCGKTCKSANHLRSHKNMHQTKQCPYCKNTLKTHSHFKLHVRRHETGTSKQVRYRTTYTCANCNYKSFNKKSLEAHMNKVHLNVRPYACSYCNKAFYKESNLREHRVVHTKAKSESCHVCAENFVNKKCLTEHMRLHSGERPYPCSICKESFTSAGRRLEHEKRKHFEKSEQCNVCGKKFSLRKGLNRHLNKVHFKERSLSSLTTEKKDD